MRDGNNADVAVAAERYMQEHNPTAALKVVNDAARDPFGYIVVYLAALVELSAKSDLFLIASIS